MAAVFRAVFGYLFLVLVVRVVGRRPGKQMAPFDFVLIFFIGGLALTGIVGDDRSLTNAFVQITTIATTHFILTLLRRCSTRFARVLDGCPLVLRGPDGWKLGTIGNMRFYPEEVMTAVRQRGIENPDQVSWAVLERSGGISIIPADHPQDDDSE